MNSLFCTVEAQSNREYATTVTRATIYKVPVGISEAHIARFFSNVPPVIVTSPGAPHTATAPPDSSALLFLNVPPSIRISDAASAPLT